MHAIHGAYTKQPASTCFAWPRSHIRLPFPAWRIPACDMLRAGTRSAVIILASRRLREFCFARAYLAQQALVNGLPTARARGAAQEPAIPFAQLAHAPWASCARGHHRARAPPRASSRNRRGGRDDRRRTRAAARRGAARGQQRALRVAGCCVAARRARWQLRVGAQRRTLRRLRACGAMDPGAHALARGGNQPVLQDMCARGVVGPAHGARACASARGEAAGAGRGLFRGGRVGAAASHACAPAPEHLHA